MEVEVKEEEEEEDEVVMTVVVEEEKGGKGRTCSCYQSNKRQAWRPFRVPYTQRAPGPLQHQRHLDPKESEEKEMRTERKRKKSKSEGETEY